MTAGVSRWRHWAAIVALCTLGAGCRSVPPQRPARAPVDISNLTHWQADGRIGVSGGEKGGSGSFQWRQSDDRAEVQIRGPVGIGSVNLQVQGSAESPQVRLQSGDGVTLEAQDAWNALEAQLGAPVPAGNLRFWMLGLAAPGEHRWSEAKPGVRVLDQEGWTIEYQQYSEDPGARVPVRIRAANGSSRVRIVVDRWQLGR